jgi:PTH2 family peptidyl-tRNA hydrolase
MEITSVIPLIVKLIEISSKNNMGDVKQVIVIRRDLNMRKGKIASQASHACMSVFFQKLEPEVSIWHEADSREGWFLPSLQYFEEYINGRFKKIVVYVNSEEELLAIHKQASDKKMHCSLIKDAGLTEFGGVPTYTAVGIGPWDSKEIDEITGHLKLL